MGYVLHHLRDLKTKCDKLKDGVFDVKLDWVDANIGN
jgi:hypothetical protein